MEFFLILLVAVVIGVFIGLKIFQNRKKLKEEYDEALRGTDKKNALEAGRKYYRSLRGGNLTIYDEQAITNDLNTMKH